MTHRDLSDRLFWMAREDEIKSAKTTDIYFLNTKEVLTKNEIDSEVVMEVYVRDLPYTGIWGVLTGVYEVAKLLEGLPVDVWSFDEGSIFLADGRTALYEPVMTIVGRYRDFAEYENPILGLLASSHERLDQGGTLQSRCRRQNPRQFWNAQSPSCTCPLDRAQLLRCRIRRNLQRARCQATWPGTQRNNAARACADTG